MTKTFHCYRCKEEFDGRGCACHDGITLIHGDCREVLPLIAPGSVDLVLTDPPYGIGYQHNGGMRGVKAAVSKTLSANRRGCSAIIGDTPDFDPTPLFSFPKVLLFGADSLRAKLPTGGTFIAWDKTLDRGPADSFVDAEFAWCNWREPRNVFSMLWKGLACDKRGEENGIRHHPTQKPLRLMRWCIERGRVAAGGLILDPFAGSGTTLRAAKDLGRRCIGIEIEEKYVKIAANRLRQEVLPFDQKPKTNAQNRQ